jgi:hypothetical protein
LSDGKRQCRRGGDCADTLGSLDRAMSLSAPLRPGGCLLSRHCGKDLLGLSLTGFGTNRQLTAARQCVRCRDEPDIRRGITTFPSLVSALTAYSMCPSIWTVLPPIHSPPLRHGPSEMPPVGINRVAAARGFWVERATASWRFADRCLKPLSHLSTRSNQRAPAGRRTEALWTQASVYNREDTSDRVTQRMKRTCRDKTPASLLGAPVRQTHFVV